MKNNLINTLIQMTKKHNSVKMKTKVLLVTAILTVAFLTVASVIWTGYTAVKYVASINVTNPINNISATASHVSTELSNRTMIDFKSCFTKTKDIVNTSTWKTVPIVEIYEDIKASCIRPKKQNDNTTNKKLNSKNGRMFYDQYYI